MLYNYNEAIELFGSDYYLKQALSKKSFFKVEKGIYSDKKDNYTVCEIVMKKYPHAFLVKDSALYHIGFIEDEPSKIHIGTARNALRIKDKRVQQHFYSNLYQPSIGYGVDHILCCNNLKSYTTENGNEIRIWDLQALLFDLIRDSKLYPQPVLIDILIKFRDCKVFTNFNRFEFKEALFYERIPFDYELLDLIDEIRDHAWKRQWEQEWNW